MIGKRDEKEAENSGEDVGKWERRAGVDEGRAK